ncbi:MAG TPA: undecaprenyl-diphosphate phosphatase [Candidatus Binataceae bacterium]|nr:undecaprenyl-diphosphate phosphatase [Candidatus Binataceae bacterium]
MLSSFQAFILGIVQGLTEFLPVSSSAHLIIVPWLLNWPEPGLAFDVALHLGTLVALVVYYWQTWLTLISSPFNGDQKSRRLLFLLIIASIPGAIIGLLFEKQAETIFHSPLVAAVTLPILGIVLWLSDRFAQSSRDMNDLGIIDALLIGISQAFAIIPGVSRSGATITIARALGIERQDAANFSFLMATPIIAGAGLIEARKVLAGGIHAPVIWGFLAAAVFGIAAIAGLIRYVRTRTYQPFAWYRVAVGIAVFIIAFV